MSVDWQMLCMGCFRQKGPQAVCGHCGYDETAPRGPLLLPHRTRLHKHYLVGRVLGKPGGFGVTYLAFDTGLETLVAIKEYLPRELVGREAGRTTVSAHSPEEGGLFRFGLEQFIIEARTLAKFDHAHLVKVRQVFAENATAYLVMDYYEGMTLAEYLQQKNRLPAATALAILNPILDGLREVHEKGFIHRDIKPQNIYLTRQGRPILLDFGTARLAMAERSRSMSVVLSAGYAPFEQYSRRGGQGPWTDVYACAAVLYFMLTGQTPAEAMDRVDEDTLTLPQRLVPDLSERLAKVIVQGLATEAKHRYQSIRAFQEALLLATDTDASPKAQTSRIASANLGNNLGNNKASAKKPLLGVVLLALMGVGFFYLLPASKSAPPLLVAPPPVEDSIGLADQKFFARQYAEALPIYQRLAEKNNSLAQFRLGSLYENGFGGVAMDAHQAAVWYERSANAGNPFGQYSVGRLYHIGNDKPMDEGQAQQWFDKAMVNGLKAAAEPLAKADDPIMSFIAARIAGHEKRYSQALAWYRPAAEQGYATAQFNFAMMYGQGEGVAKDEIEALNWCRKSAEQGLAIAQHMLGIMYLEGNGVSQNDAEAVKWIHEAAKQDYLEAQSRLGWMYQYGKGIAENATEAKHWYRLAAEKGFATAQNSLGTVYAQEKDYPEAITWLKKAADQGDMVAQFNMGNMYHVGKGVHKNLAEAKHWYQKSAQQGYDPAIKIIKMLGH